MPWRVTCAMEERERLVKAWLSGRYSVTELAEAFHVSRKTAHKWLGRFASGGTVALADRPRTALHHPNAVPDAVIQAVIRAKHNRPVWGPLKLNPGPDEPPEIVEHWPAASTRGAILARAGLVRPRRRRRTVAPNTAPFHACVEPNQTWCCDFKGWFRTEDGARCNPLTITDACTRVLIRCQGVERQDFAHSKPVFESAFKEFGLPEAMRSDNGAPFASLAAGGLSALSVWLVKLGIWPDRIDPGHPEQNGRHERMHLTLKLECCQPPAANLAAQQLRFDAFRHSYNHERPHQALALQTPASLYRPSPRTYPTLLEDPHYGADFTVRRVRSNGEIRWRGGLVFLSELLTGEAVGLREEQLGFAVYFGPVYLGRLDVRAERLVRPTGRLNELRAVTYAHS